MRENAIDNSNLQRRRSAKRRRKGAIIALIPVLVLALAGICVLMIAQNAADAATLAGALQLRMQRKPGGTWNISEIKNRARDFSAANLGETSTLKYGDIKIGRWNANTKNFTNGGSFSSRNAVQATVKCDCDLFFAHVFGSSISKVEAVSIGAFDVSQNEDGDDVFSIPYVVN